jgi:hypothetical protein
MRRLWVRFPPGPQMKIILFVIIVILIIFLGAYFYFFNNEIKVKCASAGEFGNIINCCNGLDKVEIKMSVSVNDNCYENPISRVLNLAQMFVCLDCGNGICEEEESVCTCPEDCVEKGKSDYQTIEDFCNNLLKYNCDENYAKAMPLCQLCQ